MEPNSSRYRFTLLNLVSAVFVLGIGLGLIRWSSHASPRSTLWLAVPVAILWPGVFGAVFFRDGRRSFSVGYLACGAAYLFFTATDDITWFWLLQPVLNIAIALMHPPRGGPPGSVDYVYATVHLVLLSVIALVGGLLGFILGHWRRRRVT
jgi:hypothetical protein